MTLPAAVTSVPAAMASRSAAFGGPPLATAHPTRIVSAATARLCGRVISTRFQRNAMARGNMGGILTEGRAGPKLGVGVERARLTDETSAVYRRDRVRITGRGAARSWRATGAPPRST